MILSWAIIAVMIHAMAKNLVLPVPGIPNNTWRVCEPFRIGCSLWASCNLDVG